MLICSLHKPESTYDQVRKAYPKLKPTDAALIATALVLSGRYALAVYDNKQFNWPADHEGLTKELLKEIEIVQQSLANNAKKTAKPAEEELTDISVSLLPNYPAGEKILSAREDLKTLLSDILQEGVEFNYSPGDIGWLWALDHVNWSVISNGELGRRFKFKGKFADKSVGVELSAQGTKKKVTRAKSSTE